MLNTGLSLAGTNDPLNNYKYNDKEIQKELNLEWLDYGARFYDPQIGRWHQKDPKTELLEMSSPYVYSLNSPIDFIDKAGELPIFINGRVNSENERGNVSYWDYQLLRTIANSGIPNPGGEIHFVDGDRGQDPADRYFTALGHSLPSPVRNDEGLFASDRTRAGYTIGKADFKNILALLARDPKTGKIIEKIQIYTHSRGAAFGAGYTEALLEMINQNADKFEEPNNEIDFVYNMAPHQSSSINAPKGVNEYSQNHTSDLFSGNNMGGLKGAFTTNEKSSGLFGAHSSISFTKDVRKFINAFINSKGDSKKTINDFVNRMRNDYGINVTVK